MYECCVFSKWKVVIGRKSEWMWQGRLAVSSRSHSGTSTSLISKFSTIVFSVVGNQSKF